MNVSQRITAPPEWGESALEPRIRSEIEEIVSSGRLKPGFRALFHGPSGTGKTLAACLLGDAGGLPVFRIDLPKVLSEWTGETEESLARLFDEAEHQDRIFFFDEADLLFEKRTESRNANDRAANQQIAYLLQRIEDFPGIVILATETLARRFETVIHFPVQGQ